MRVPCGMLRVSGPAAAPKPKPNPFGDAKPVDTLAREREVEERRRKQQQQDEEEARRRKAAAGEAGEGLWVVGWG